MANPHNTVSTIKKHWLNVADNHYNLSKVTYIEVTHKDGSHYLKVHMQDSTYFIISSTNEVQLSAFRVLIQELEEGAVKVDPTHVFDFNVRDTYYPITHITVSR